MSSTFVPLGIKSFDNKFENKYISLSYTLSDNAQEVTLQIRDGEEEIYKKVITSPSEVSKGQHFWSWDGFDKNGILDTARLTKAKRLNYKISVKRKNNIFSETQYFKLSYSEVNWVDVKINRPDKKIFVTLRVDLRDGGEKGLTCTQSSLQSITANSYSVGGCPWDFIPKNRIKAIGKPPIKSRTRSFENLRDLVLEGIAYHWSRNNLPNSNVATGVNINGQDYEVFVQAINTTENAMDNVDVVYNTNTFWGRSNNPGNVTGFKSLMANTLQFIPLVPLNETIFYNVGYVNNNYKYESYLLFEKDSWIYIDDTLLDLKGRCKVDMEFSYTAAHEIGHNILRSYAEGGGGSADYSYKHKGSSGYSETKSVSEGGVIYPRKGEIDLMKYYNNTPYFLDFDFDRIVAAEEDVKGLLWLTKIKIKK